ncbi:MAG: hypothetical protein ACYS5V_04165 [Planctomycetota bacterium]|jgi:hypothetical protein
MSTDTAETEVQQEDTAEDIGVLDEQDRAYIDSINRGAAGKKPAEEEPEKEPEAEPEAEQTTETPAEELAEEETEGEPGAETKPDADWVDGDALALAASVGMSEELLREHFESAEDLKSWVLVQDRIAQRRRAAEAERLGGTEDTGQTERPPEKKEETGTESPDDAAAGSEDTFRFGPRVKIPRPLDPEEYGAEIAAVDRSHRDRLERAEAVLSQLADRVEDTMAFIGSQEEQQFDAALDALGREDLYGKGQDQASPEQFERRKAVWETYSAMQGRRPVRAHVERASDGTHHKELVEKSRKDFTKKIRKQSAKRSGAGGPTKAPRTSKAEADSKTGIRLSPENADKLDRLYDELGLSEDEG